MDKAVKKYNSDVIKIRSNMNVLPPLTSRNRIIYAIYDLALVIKENLSVLKRDKEMYEDIPETFRQQMDIMFNSLVDYIGSVRKAETRQELLSILDEISLRVVVTVQGLMAIAPAFNMRFSRYNDNYSTSQLEAGEVLAAFTTASAYIATNRQSLNILHPLAEHITVERNCSSEIFDCMTALESRGISPDVYVYAPGHNNFRGVSRLSDAEDRVLYKKIITGDSADVTVSTQFDMTVSGTMYMNCFFDLDIDDVDESFKKNFLFGNAHTGYGGIEMVGLPKIFLNRYVLELLSNYLDNMHVVSTGTNSLFAVVVGNRKNKVVRNIDAIVDAMVETLTTSSDFSISLHNKQADKIAFRSAYPTAEEIFSSFSNSRNFIERMNNSLMKTLELKTEEETRHPLLPFSPGQLSLVLVSGDVDGVLVEDGTYCHAIKGATVRTPMTTTEYDDTGNIITKVTNVPATSVKMLTADGVVKSLL